jgi:hypothetical protein
MNEKRIVPQAVDTEAALLGAILTEPEALGRVADAVDPTDFYNSGYQSLFGLLLEMFDEKEPIDIVTVAQRLKDKAVDVLSVADLSSLVDGMPTAANIEAYAIAIRDKARVRAVMSAAAEIAEGGYKPGLDAKEYLGQAQAMILRAAVGERRIYTRIEQYVKRAGDRQFTIQGILAWLGIKAAAEKEDVDAVIARMEGDGIITRVGTKHGVYRGVDQNPQVMQLWQKDMTPLKIVLPLNLHRIVNLYSRNVILVAGEKDAGKTAFSLNVAWMNRDTVKVQYFNSEMGVMELQKRLDMFSYPRDEWQKITWIERASRFEDFIDPEGLNIIDFLEVGADAYAVVEDIKRVFDRLTTGLLLIVMQKRSYKEFAVGGEATLEKSRLAVNLEHRKGQGNVCKITVAKNWTGLIKHPRGMECQYKVHMGGRMEIDGEWYDPEDMKQVEGPKQKKLKIVAKKRGEEDFVHED